MARGNSSAVNPLLAALEEERRQSNPLLRALDEERAAREREEAEGPGIVDRALGTLSRGVRGIADAYAPEDDDGTLTAAAKAGMRGLGSALATASPLANVGRTVAGIRERAVSGEAERDFAKDEGFVERAGDLMERGIASTSGGLATAVGGLTGSQILKNEGDTFRSTANRALAGEQTWDDLKADFSFRKLGQFVAEQSIQSLPEMAMLLSGVGVGISAAGRTGNIAADRAENNFAEDVSAKDVLLSAGFGTASALLDRFGLDKILKPTGAHALVRVVQAGGAEAGTEFLQGIIENAGGSLGTEQGMDWAAAFDEGLAGAVAGAGMGGTIRGTIEAGSAVDKFRQRRAGAAEQPGIVSSAGEAAATLTPDDEASALPNDLIAEGKRTIAENDAAQAADERLEAAGLPKLGRTVKIYDTEGNAVRGRVADVFEGGFKLELPEGGTLDYYLDDITDAGDTVEEIEQTAEEIDADAAARAETAKAEMERLRQESAAAAQRTDEAFGYPANVPAPAPAPQATGATVTGEAAIAGFKARTRRAESGGKDGAKNPNSSATGRYQFIEGTFKQVYKQVYGGGDAAANAAWANKRNDPAIQEALMDRFTRDNAAGLAKAGIPVTEGNLYLAHFAGIGGAQALHRNPGASAESVLGAAVVNANPFLAGKSAGDVIAWAAGKMGGKAPALGQGSVGDSTTQIDEDVWENPYAKALEDYRRQGEAESSAAPDPFTADAPPIPDDPTRPDPASVYADQPNVTSDAAGAPLPSAGIGGEPSQPGGDAAAPVSDEPFDAAKWQGDRDQRIKLSKEAGTKHLDDLNRSVEGMRGKPFYNVHDPKERGTVRTVANTGDVVVDWADDYSREKNLSDDGQSWLMPSDLRDYAVGSAPAAPSPAPSATTADGGDIPVVDQPVTTSPVVDRVDAELDYNTTPRDERVRIMEAAGVNSLMLAGGPKRNSATPFADLPRPVQTLIDSYINGGRQAQALRQASAETAPAEATNPVTPEPIKTPSNNIGEQEQGLTQAPLANLTTGSNETRAPIATRPGRPEDERINRDVAISPTGREAPVEYRVAELGDIVASHTPDGAVNPAFPAERQPRERDSSASRIQVAKIAGNLNPRLLGRNVLASDGAPIVSQGGIVEAGNGRIAALDLAYQQFPDKAQAYRDYLKQEGFDVEGMERPVLVRVLDPSVSAEDAFALTRESNQRSTAEMSVTEQAAVDAEKLTDDLVNAYRGGSPTAPANQAFVQRYFEEVADPNARATLYDDDGNMTQAAQARITAALLQRAFGNRALVKDVAESVDPDVKAIGNVLSDVAGMWARMKAAAGNGTIDPAFDITENVNEAVSIVAQARKTKRNVAEFVAQNGIFTGKIPARTEAVLRMMFRNPNFTRPTGQAPLKQMFEWYIEQAMQSSGLFASPDATPDATLSQARENTLGEGIDVEPDAGRPGDERIRGSVREGGTGRDGADAGVPEQRGTPGEGEGQSLNGSPQTAEPTAEAGVDSATTAEAAANAPRPAAASAGSSRTTAGKGLIGQNAKGFDVFEDERGVRSYVENGIRLTEAVGIVPGGGITIDVSNRWDDYKTTSELGAERAEKEKRVRAEAERLLQRAARFQTELAEWAAGTEWAKLFSNPGLKGIGRIVEKTINDGYDGPTALKDIVRGAFFVETQEQADALEAAINERFNVLQDKGWQVVRGGYFDHKMILEFEGGIKAELQIVPSAVWDAKKGRNGRPNMDAIYDVWRAISGFDSESPSAEALELEYQMMEGYANAALGGSFASLFNSLSEAKAAGNSAFNSLWERLRPTLRTNPGAARQPGAPSSGSGQTNANPRPSDTPLATGRNSISENDSNVGITSEREVTSNGEKSKGDSAYGANNRLVTQDRREELRRLLREKLNPNRLNAGIDPTILMAGAELGVFHLEAGARKFVDFAKAVATDLGVRPVDLKQYLRAWYNGARDMMEDAGAPVGDMDTPDQVRAALSDLEATPESGITQADAEPSATQAPRGDDRTGDDGSRAGDAPRAPADGSTGDLFAEPGRGSARDVRDDDGRGDPQVGNEEPQADGRGADERTGASDVERGGNGNRAGNRVRRKSADRGTDYLAPKGSLKRAGSWKATAERNLDVIELVNRLDAEGRPATPEEQKQLAAFTGWGASEIANGLLGNVGRKQDGTRELRTHPWGDKTAWNPLIERAQKLLTGDMLETALQSTQYAHYTSEEVIRSIWDGMARLGFTGGRILEPGMGNGLFAVAAPGEIMGGSSYTGIEMDAFTAKVAGYLLPQENVLASDYTKTKLPDGFFDVAIGNPPFANIKILDDPAYKKHRFSLHDYFFAKSIDKVRPGGLMVFVTSRYTMDKQDAKARQYLADRADLLGAIRLPQTAFKENAGTEVVTDVLFFQRRAPGQEPGGQAWLGLKTVKAGTEKVMVNEYFAANPKMVLGKHATTGSMYRANEYTVEPMASMSIEKAFARAIEALPVGVYTEAPKAAKEAAQAKTFERDFAPASEKEGGLYLKGGALMVVESGSGVPVEAKGAEAAWLKDYVPLRDALKAAQKDQLQDGDWEKSHKALVKAYDGFVKKHGNILAFTTTERKTVNDDGEESVTVQYRFKNKRLLAFDVESPLVTQLERITDEGKIERGPFLAGRTLNKPTQRAVETVQDALAVTLDEIGRLDLDYIGKQLGRTREEVIEDLGDSIYEAPDGTWQTEDEYLSGDVVTKLEEAEAAARADPRFERNVKALTERQPAPLAYSDINVKLGVGWIKPEYIAQFADEVLGYKNVPVSYNPTLGTWEVTGAKDRWRRSDTDDYGTSDRSPLELLDAKLNNRTIKVTRTDSDKKTYVDANATVAANEAAKKLAERFQTWIWEDGNRAGELADYYNRNFNNLAPRKFNGDHLTLPGLASKFAANTHPHVKRAVWRQIQTGNTYLAHAVGAGKTREMIIGGMEQKRLGLIKKPMYVVPNHMLEQFRAEFLEAYPAANLLVADEHAFHTDNRKRFMAQAALNDPDAIIVTHSSFGKIDTSDEARAGVVRELIGELEAAMQELGDDRSTMHTRKKIEKQIEQITRRFAGKTGGAKDKALTFEEMGVDFLYIDEAHEFRKLDFATNRTAKGIDPVGSQKALDLFIKIRWLEKQRPGRSVVLASGTPVTNTMAELFTVMRYMAKDQLDRDGIGSFDGWAAMFGEVAAGYEQNAAGGYEIVERFAKFVNVPELMKRVRTFMDVLTSDQLGDLVQRPKLNGGVPHSEVVPASEALDAYMKLELDARLKKSREWKPSKDQPGNPDPVINIISDARLSAIDMRFVRPGSKPDPNSKLNRMLAKIVERHKATRGLEYTSPSGGKDLRKGAVQIVFSAVGFGEQASKNRGFNLREWVDGQLVAGGIKKSEIAWMSDANTHAKKAQLQKDVRAGKVAVLIGSPKNMGTGLNVQKRLRDLHYLSPPWYPSDVEQPHGRIIRQGNENPEVDIWWYAAKGTYDSTAWGMVSRKQKFIEQALTGDNSVRVLEDISESSQYEMAAALAAGDERIIQVAALSAEVDRLQRLEQSHADNQRQLRRNVRDLDKHMLPEAEKLVGRYEEAQKLKGTGYEPFAATVGGKTYDKPGEAGAAIIEAATEATRGAVKVVRSEIGKLRGKFPITVEPTAWGPDTFAVMVNIGPLQREIADRLSTKNLLPFENVDPVGMVRKAENVLANVTGGLADARKRLETLKAERAANEKRIGAPFAEAGLLAEKVAERAQLQAELAAETKAKEAVGKGAGPAATPVDSRPEPALLRVGDGEPATRRELKDLERDLNARLEKIAGKRVQLRITDRIGLAGASSVGAVDGRYFPSMKLIEVASDATRGAAFTLDHEAVHALRDLGAFSPADWMLLKNAARKDEKLWASIQRRYPDLPEEAQLEEAVADMFARFQDDGDAIGKLGRAVVRTLVKVLKILEAIMEGLKGNGFAIRRSSGDVMLEMRAGRTKADIGKFETGNAVNKASVAEALESRTETDTLLSLAGSDPSWKGKAAAAYDAFRKAMQDRYLPLMRTQEKIEAMTGQAIPEHMNPYLGEELMSGRIGARLETLSDDHVRPLFDAMAEADITIEALESYLYARHARERNAQIAKINPEMPDGGSGMTNTEARAILNRVARSDKAQAMEALAARVDAIRDMALDYRVETGLMSADDAAKWRDTYQHYVPLRGRAEVEGNSDSAARINRSGGGINVRGKESKRAYGRRSQADSPLAYLILQAEEAIVRGETNRVAQKFVALAKANPDAEFWQVQKVSSRTRINEETGLVENYLTNQLLAEDKDWTVSAKIDGKEVRVTMNRANPQARRLADSMKRLTEHQLDFVTEHLGKLNRFLSMVNTTYNPEFVIANAVRDIQTAAINIQDADVKGLEGKMLEHYAGALKAAMRGAHGNRAGEWGQWYSEFVNEGGRVYFNRVEDVGEIKATIEKEFALAASKAGKGNATLHAKRAFLKARDVVENTNLGVENAVRLAAYRAARESGLTKAQAASLAKNLTVNFNRRGTFGPAMNAAYLFYNASIQGSVRMLTAIHKSKSVRRTLAGVMVAGLAIELLNAMLTDDDDDGESFYDKIPAHEKQRNIIIMTGGADGAHIKIPLPYGYNVFFGAGRAVGEIWRKGGKGWQDSLVSVVETAADSFNPIGGTGSLLNFFAPTALDPAVDLTLNRDFTERPIMPEQNPFGPPVPDSQRAWPGVGPHWKAITDFVGEATGGNDIEPGAVDVSPETLEYLSGVVFGAAGAFVDRMISLPLKAVEGDLDPNDIPFARKVTGGKAGWVDKNLYYERSAAIETVADRARKYADSEDAAGLEAFQARNEAMLTMEGDTGTEGSRKWAEKIMRQVRKDRRLNDKLLERGEIDAAAHRENLDGLKAIEDDTVLKFNTAWNAVVNNSSE